MSTSAPAPRGALDAIPAYRPGKPPKAKPGVVSYKISSNEIPDEPLPSVLKAVADAAEDINRYPNYFADDAVARIAEYHGVAAENVAVGPGSSGVIAQMFQTLCDPGDEVVFAWRSFEAYPILARVAGAEPVMVPLTDDGRHDLDAMAAAITDKTRVVIVCTPNNPTGTTVTPAEVDAFLAKVPQRVLVVIDEAYAQFVRADVPDAIELFVKHNNVAMTRTFSKAYGLAGLRIGYAVAPADIADGLRKTMVPFSVTNLAQHAAITSLDVEDELMKRVNAVVQQRGEVVAALAQAGYEIPDAQGNFVWLPLGERSEEFAQLCASSGITVRPFAGEGVRVSIGEPEANERFVQIAKEFASTSA